MFRGPTPQACTRSLRSGIYNAEEFMGKLEGKIALITGGNSGIGFATAKRFVQEGAYVFVTGRAQSKLDEAVKQIGSSVTGVPCDVTVAADLDRLFERIKKDKGKLDIVFANAGIAKYAALGSIDEELFDSTFDTNVKGMLFTVQKALPLLADGSSILLNASIVAAKVWRRTAFIPRRKPPCDRSPVPGPWISSTAGSASMQSVLARSIRKACASYSAHRKLGVTA
jgi:NAD(P)-dependent dehydrogenase (short-subunit alcohol dehydrogenase family)